MAATGQTVEMWKGDTLTLTIPVRDQDGAIVDLSGATARWWMGKNSKASGSDVYIQKTASIMEASGLYSLVVNIVPGDTEDLAKTGTFYHEAEVIDSSGRVSTVTVGDFVLYPAIITPAS
jgi:hypothetical protein